MQIAVGDVAATTTPVVATLAVGWCDQATDGYPGGVTLTFSAYLAVAALPCTLIALRDLLAACRLQRAGQVVDGSPSGHSYRFGHLVADAEQHPFSAVTNEQAAY